MRIDAYSAVNQVYQAKSSYKSKAVNAYTHADDKFEISETAKSYSTAKTAVSQASDIRMDKVADIKAKLAAGTYNISSEDIADKMLDNMETISF